MRIGALEVPLGLVRLIQAKRWPQSGDEERRQHLLPIVPTDRVHRFAPEEDGLYLYAPPFRTVQQCCESGETFWEESIAAPGELDFARAVPIADFGLGTDAPVCSITPGTRRTPRCVTSPGHGPATTITGSSPRQPSTSSRSCWVSTPLDAKRAASPGRHRGRDWIVGRPSRTASEYPAPARTRSPVQNTRSMPRSTLPISSEVIMMNRFPPMWRPGMRKSVSTSST